MAYKLEHGSCTLPDKVRPKEAFSFEQERHYGLLFDKLLPLRRTRKEINRSSPGCGANASVVIGVLDMRLSKTRPEAPDSEIIWYQKRK